MNKSANLKLSKIDLIVLNDEQLLSIKGGNTDSVIIEDTLDT